MADYSGTITVDRNQQKLEVGVWVVNVVRGLGRIDRFIGDLDGRMRISLWHSPSEANSIVMLDNCRPLRAPGEFKVGDEVEYRAGRTEAERQPFIVSRVDRHPQCLDNVCFGWAGRGDYWVSSASLRLITPVEVREQQKPQSPALEMLADEKRSLDAMWKKYPYLHQALENEKRWAENSPHELRCIVCGELAYNPGGLSRMCHAPAGGRCFDGLDNKKVRIELRHAAMARYRYDFKFFQSQEEVLKQMRDEMPKNQYWVGKAVGEPKPLTVERMKECLDKIELPKQEPSYFPPDVEKTPEKPELHVGDEIMIHDEEIGPDPVSHAVIIAKDEATEMLIAQHQNGKLSSIFSDDEYVTLNRCPHVHETRAERIAKHFGGTGEVSVNRRNGTVGGR